MPARVSRRDRVADVLQQAEQLVAAIRDPAKTRNRFQEALDTLRKLARTEGIPIAFVGGVATIYHGYPRSTEDIDIVVSDAHFNSLIRSCPEYGITVKHYDPFGAHLDYQGVPIDVLREEMRGQHHPPLTALMGIEAGADFANFPGWVLSKIVSGRMKDEADVVEVLKTKTAADFKSVAAFLRRHAPALVDDFRQMIAVAQAEQAGHRAGGSRK
jgi:hypothetical protein